MKQYVRRNPDVTHAVQFIKPEDVQDFMANHKDLSPYTAEVCEVPHPLVDGLILQTMVFRRKGHVFKTALFHTDWLIYEDGVLKRFTDAEFKEKFVEKPQYQFRTSQAASVPLVMPWDDPLNPSRTSLTTAGTGDIYVSNAPNEATYNELVQQRTHEVMQAEAQRIDKEMSDMMRKQREDLKRKGLDL